MEYLKPRFIDELNADGEIEIAGNRWTRHEVLETMDPIATADVFDAWVGESKQAARARADVFLTEFGCRDRFIALTNRHRNGNLVPVIGAGMSMTSGLPSWGPFLRGLAPDDAIRDAVSEMIGEGRFEEAAQLIVDTRGEADVAESLHNVFGSHRRNAAGPVRLLPHVFAGEVLTTNFDYVTDEVYRAAQNPFRLTLSGPELRTAPQRIGNDPHCLLRLHGEGDTALSRVLTLAEYENAYDDNHTLHGVLGAIVGLRSLLFLGCSLSADRTLSALQRIREEARVDAPRHYAFLVDPGPAERQARAQSLGPAGVFPIYYPADDHDQGVEDLLITLMEGGL